jgi:hypothetical protein
MVILLNQARHDIEQGEVHGHHEYFVKVPLGTKSKSKGVFLTPQQNDGETGMVSSFKTFYNVELRQIETDSE